MSMRELFVCVAIGMCVLPGCDDGKKDYIETVLSVKDKGELVACKQQLSSLASYLNDYAEAHNDEFPPSLGDLDVLSQHITCPGARGRAYGYVKGKNTRSSRDEIVLYEAKPAHGPTCNVLLVGGMVEEMTPEELAAALDGN